MPLSDERSAQFRALFEPRGVVVAGASSHPGKFGFVTLHNLRRYLDIMGQIRQAILVGEFPTFLRAQRGAVVT